MMYKAPVLRIKQAHVSDSTVPIKLSWKQLLFLYITITSSFWGLRSFHQMLNKFKYRTPVFLLQEVTAYTHICAHTCIHKPFFVICLFCAVLRSSLFYYWERYKKRNWLQRRINPAQSSKKAVKTKRPSVPMWIQSPYHFIKMTPDAFFSLWSQERASRLTEQGFWRGGHLSDVF